MASPASMRGADSFHFFSQLPPELRLRIWDLNLPASRLIPLHSDTDLSSSTKPISPTLAVPTTPPGFSSSAAIPANLHACAESRSHALATRYGRLLSFGRTPGRVLADTESDVLYFPARQGYMASSAQFHTAMSLCAPEELCQIRRLALHEDLFASGAPALSNSHEKSFWGGLDVTMAIECLRLVRQRMPAVDQIMFVAGPGQEAAERLTSQVRTAMHHITAEGDTDWIPPNWMVVREP